MRTTDKSSGRAELNEAYERLDHEVPDALASILRWLRDPDARRVRLAVGILLIVLSFHRAAAHCAGCTKRRELKVVPLCWFVQEFVERNPECRDVLASG